MFAKAAIDNLEMHMFQQNIYKHKHARFSMQAIVCKAVGKRKGSLYKKYKLLSSKEMVNEYAAKAEGKKYQCV